MADLSEHDKQSLLGPIYQDIAAQNDAESARTREKWKCLTPCALALIGAISIFVLAAGASF